MSEKKHTPDAEQSEVVLAKAKDFWSRNSKPILGVGAALLVVVAGFFIYKQYFVKPKEEKAADVMSKAEEYFRLDSTRLALNGDGQNIGFLTVMSRYSGTEAANLAAFYAGACYIKLDDNANAIKYLKKFSSDAKQIQQRAYKLLGDAYADQGNGKEALDYYKKSAHHFEADKAASAEALFLAAYLADRVLKDPKQAIALFKELKEKFPATPQGTQVDQYLAQLGEYNAN